LAASSLYRPIPALNSAVQEKPVLAMVLLTFLQGLSFYGAVLYVHSKEGFAAFCPIVMLSHWFWIVLYLLSVPQVLWFLKSAVANLVAEFLGGPSRGLSVLSALACSFSPMTLSLPVALLIRVFGGHDLSVGFASQIWFLSVVTLWVWSGILSFIAVRETYKFTPTQVIATLLITILVAFVLLLLSYLGAKLLVEGD